MNNPRISNKTNNNVPFTPALAPALAPYHRVTMPSAFSPEAVVRNTLHRLGLPKNNQTERLVQSYTDQLTRNDTSSPESIRAKVIELHNPKSNNNKRTRPSTTRRTPNTTKAKNTAKPKKSLTKRSINPSQLSNCQLITICLILLLILAGLTTDQSNIKLDLSNL